MPAVAVARLGRLPGHRPVHRYRKMSDEELEAARWRADSELKAIAREERKWEARAAAEGASPARSGDEDGEE